MEQVNLLTCNMQSQDSPGLLSSSIAEALRLAATESFACAMLSALGTFAERAVVGNDHGIGEESIDQAGACVAMFGALLRTLQEANLLHLANIDILFAAYERTAESSSSEMGHSGRLAFLGAMAQARDSAIKNATAPSDTLGPAHQHFDAADSRIAETLSVCSAGIADFARGFALTYLEGLNVVKLGPKAGRGLGLSALSAVLGFGQEVISAAAAVARRPGRQPVGIWDTGRGRLQSERLVRGGPFAVGLATMICDMSGPSDS